MNDRYYGPFCERHPTRPASYPIFIGGVQVVWLCQWCKPLAKKAAAQHPDEIRWVAASTKRGVVSHAVLALGSTPPIKMRYDEKYGKWRNPRNRPARTACGVRVRNYIAGSNHGHDFDRTSDTLKCKNCIRALEAKK